MNHPHSFLIVEYDTDSANRWVPYPLSRTTLGRLSIGTIDRIPSAFASAASRAQKTARAVWLPPAPAMTGGGRRWRRR